MSEQPKFSDGISELERFLETSKLKYINKALKLEKYSSISKLLFYLALPGVIFVILSIFIIEAWILCWIYALVIIIFMGFIFAKPSKKFNFAFIIGIFALLAFIPSIYGQSTLSVLSVLWGDGSATEIVSSSDMAHLTEVLEPIKEYLREEHSIKDVIETMIIYGADVEDFTDYYHGDYTYFFKLKAWPPTDKRAIKHKVYQALTEAFEYIVENDLHVKTDISGFIDTLGKLTENPLADLPLYIRNFTDIMNWIVFLLMIGYGASGFGDFLSGRWERIAQKAAFISAAIAIMVLIYALFQSIGVPIRTVWDTLGSAWNSMLKGIKLASLDQSGNATVNVKSVVNGFFSWIPLIITLSLFGLAFAFRKSDFKSVLFTRNIFKENTIEVEPSKFSIPIAVVLFIMGIYVVGYFLITAEPTITISPLITLIFYLFSVVVLFLLGFKVLILNKEFTIKSFTLETLKWTIFGLFGLYLWFQVFQPVAYKFNLTDTPTSLITLSQDASVFENNILKQLFLIACPETLIFQIFPVGLGNRVYFYLRRTRIWKEEEKRLRLKRWKIAEQYRNIKINPDSVSKENIRKIAKLTVLKQKYDKITETIERDKIQRVPFRFFIIPTIISGLLGSFLFSWYHSFRRGIDFINWWQNPMLGMVYFGAGFFLCFIAFFNILAAIFVHAFNNIIALMLAGAV